jgi:hypothetical protein
VTNNSLYGQSTQAVKRLPTDERLNLGLASVEKPFSPPLSTMRDILVKLVDVPLTFDKRLAIFSL